MIQIMRAEEDSSLDLWLYGAEWSSGFALPWWFGGWRRSNTGLANEPEQ